MYKNLLFFDKQGENLNLTYDETNDSWYGVIYLPRISVGLIETLKLYILEDVILDGGNHKYTYPIGEYDFIGSFIENDKFKFYSLESINSDELLKYDTLQFDIFNTPYTINNTYKDVSEILDEALQLNILYNSDNSGNFTDILKLIDSNGHEFLKIELYFEAENEDERLNDLLVNLGINIFKDDFKIFKDTNVKEEFVDWIFLNTKRKEILLEHHNIFPYTGSYKALINIIKYFGYDNVKLKEYWENIESNSINFGKYKKVNIDDFLDTSFQDEDLPFSIPSKIHKKTNLFGLYYNITEDSGMFDDSGVPIVKESFNFTIDEILIKIFALKNKLKHYFLPLNARIIDIVGEAVYYGLYDLSVWNQQTRIDYLSSGIKPKIEVYPKNEQYITDVRHLLYYGCPVGRDLSLNGITTLYSYRFGIKNDIDIRNFTDQFNEKQLIFDITFSYDIESYKLSVIFERDLDTNKYYYTINDILTKIVNTINTNSILKNKFNSYIESNKNIIRIIQKQEFNNVDITIDVHNNVNTNFIDVGLVEPDLSNNLLDIQNNNYNLLQINPSADINGSFGVDGPNMSYYEECFLGFFNDLNTNIKNLSDNEDALVGCPIILYNDSFNFKLDDLDITFNQLDEQGDSFDDIINLKFSQFNNSKILTGFDISNNPIYINVDNFPTLEFPSNKGYTINNLTNLNFHECQWIIEGVDNNFYHESERNLINDLKSYSIILPYVGKYNISLKLFDLFNSTSKITNNNLVDVKLPEADFIGWYRLGYKDYIFNDIENYISVNEYNTMSDLPYINNTKIEDIKISIESLDDIEYYQNLINEEDDLNIDQIGKNVYELNKVGSEAKIKDLDHIQFINTDSYVSKFETKSNFTEINKYYLFITNNNTLVNIDSDFYVYDNYIQLDVSNFNTSDIIIFRDSGELYIVYNDKFNLQHIKYDLIEIDINDMSTYELKSIANVLNKQQYNILNNFIIYYKKDITSNREYLEFVSKDFSKSNRHKVKLFKFNDNENLLNSNHDYITNYFGHLGDIPAGFEIFDITSDIDTFITITENNISETVEITSDNLIDLRDELENINNNLFKTFDYKIVYEDENKTIPIKIICSKKYVTYPNEIFIEYSDNILGTSYGRTLMKNVNLTNLAIIEDSAQLPILSLINFTYDNCEIYSKQKPLWILTKENDINFEDIYFRNKYFSYLFTQRGSYTLTLELEDNNGNKNSVIKKEIVKII